MHRRIWFLTLLCMALLLLPLAAALTFTVSTETDWNAGTLDGVTVRNDSLELETPLEEIGFETQLALSYWEIHRGDAFVPETGFTGNDAIALNGSDPVPGVGNLTQMNYSIPDVYVIESGSQFSAWAKHNGSEGSSYTIAYRLEGPDALVAGSVDEELETLTCETDQEEQVIGTDALSDSWYRFAFSIYPSDSTVNCAIYDHNGTLIGDANLSATIDFSRVVLRANGDNQPWAWFDEVTIPRYRAEGTYTSQLLDNTNIQDWKRLQVDASNITSDADVDAIMDAQDSSGTVIESQVINLGNGQQNYDLTLPNSQDATITLNGTTLDAATTWSVAAYTLFSNKTNTSAPSLDQPSVSPTTADAGDTLTFTAELTDDDGDENTVALWTRKNGTTDWIRREQTTVIPVSADTQVSLDHSFTVDDEGSHYFLFNTTDAHDLTDDTRTGTFTINVDETQTDTQTSDEQTESTSDEQTTEETGASGNTGTSETDTTTNETTDQGPENTTTQEDTAEDTRTGQEPSSDEEQDTGTNWLLLLVSLVLIMAAISGYFFHMYS